LPLKKALTQKKAFCKYKIISLLLISTFIFTNNAYPSQHNLNSKDTLRLQSQFQSQEGIARHAYLQKLMIKAKKLLANRKNREKHPFGIVGMPKGLFGTGALLTAVFFILSGNPIPATHTTGGALSLQAAQAQKQALREDRGVSVTDIADGIQKLMDPNTGLPPSHMGHPGYENLAYLYDLSVDALILNADGRQKAAEIILDYFDKRLQIPLTEAQKSADANQVYGILKLLKAIDPKKIGQSMVVAPINAINRTSTRRQGEGQLEFFTTPGPISWLIFAMSDVNRIKYAKTITLLDRTLRAMQDSAGGIHDGDRLPRNVHTEPHVDASDAFIMTSSQADSVAALLMAANTLIDRTPWPEAAERGWQWFKNHVFDPIRGIINQGYGPGGPSTTHATDAYTWTMGGAFGDRIQKEYGLEALKRLSLELLHRGLVQVTWTRPDGVTKTSLLLDFSDPTEPALMRPVVTDPQHPDFGVARGGYHPAGSPEWTGGGVTCFQKNAVRCWKAGDREGAIWFKALAIALEAETDGCFYTIDGVTMTVYATGQNIGTAHGWVMPLYYVITPQGEALVRGGSTVGGWIVLPKKGRNPFIQNDDYKEIYDQIPDTPVSEAIEILRKELRHKPFTEKPLVKIPESTPGLVEARVYNDNMWNAFNRSDYTEAIRWANKTMAEQDWVNMAKRQNEEKAGEIGGLIDYQWGQTFPNNESPIHDAIWKYPLLNELATAMWGMAASNNKLGNREETKRWIRRIINEVPLHQIAHTRYNPATGKNDLIDGYWNGIVSMEGGEMGDLYDEVLREIGTKSAPPRTVTINVKEPQKKKTEQKIESPQPERTPKPELRPEPKAKQQAVPEAGAPVKLQGEVTILTEAKIQPYAIERGDGQENIFCEAFRQEKPWTFDFSDATGINIVFDKGEAGKNVVIRLRTKGIEPHTSIKDKNAGFNTKVYTIPRGGILYVPTEEFGVPNYLLKEVTGILVYSGSSVRGIDLGQSRDVHAVFKEMQIIGEVPVSVKATMPKPEVKQEAQTIILGTDFNIWDGYGSHVRYIESNFDLSDAKSLRLVFPKSQTGINIFVRLLDNRGMANSSKGRTEKFYTIPANGILDIPITVFPYRKDQLKKIEQISVHSGSNAWNIPLEQDENAVAEPITIGKVIETSATGDQGLLGPSDKEDTYIMSIFMDGELSPLGHVIKVEGRSIYLYQSL